MWIDADAVFVRFDKDIRDEIEKGKDFYICLIDFKNRVAPNSGFFMFRKSAWSLNFLDRVWNKKEYTYHNYWENAAIIDLLGYKNSMNYNKSRLFLNGLLYRLKIKNFVTHFLRKTHLNTLSSKFFKNLPEKKSRKKKEINLARVKWLSSNWNNLPGRVESKKAIVNHYPSKPFNERLAKMTEDVKNYTLK